MEVILYVQMYTIALLLIILFVFDDLLLEKNCRGTDTVVSRFLVVSVAIVSNSQSISSVPVPESLCAEEWDCGLRQTDR